MIGDFIDFISRLEASLEDYYTAVRDNSNDNDAKLLSYYLSRHYRYVRAALLEFGPEKLDKIRQKRIGGKLDFPREEWPDLMNMPPDKITGDDLLKIAVRYNGKLTTLYRDILKQPLAKGLPPLIRTLQRLEKKESTTFKKMLAMHYF